MAKAVAWSFADAEARKRGERSGLDTRVVHAVNDGHSAFDDGTSVGGGLS